jgi:hypothetical protein
MGDFNFGHLPRKKKKNSKIRWLPNASQVPLSRDCISLAQPLRLEILHRLLALQAQEAQEAEASLKKEPQGLVCGSSRHGPSAPNRMFWEFSQTVPPY